MNLRCASGTAGIGKDQQQSGPAQTDAARSDTAAFAAWFQTLLGRGVYWAPSQFESIFVSAAHTDHDLNATLDAARAAYAGLGRTA